MRKSILLLLCLVSIGIPQAFSSHFIGGYIRYECLSNGYYRFYLTVYQDANSAGFPQTDILQSDYPGLPQISMNNISVVDIIATCPSVSSCSGLGYACVREHTYTSDLAYPNGVYLSQAPSTQGWTFYYSHCCRPPSTNVALSSSSTGVLRVTIFASAMQSMYPCTDHSPRFLGKPSSIAPTNQEIIQLHAFADSDSDSLYYEWGVPWNGYNTPASFNPGYSHISPFYTMSAGTIPSTIEPNTGDLRFKAPQAASHFYGVQVSAYSKCTQQKLSDTYFEFFQSHLSGPDSLPRFTAPLGNGTVTPLASFIDTVYAGALYQLNVNAFDPDSIQTSVQSVLLTAWGTQFDSNSIGSNSQCPNPPCATLTPALPYASPIQTSTLFEWQTSCNHLDTCLSPTEYQFFFRAEDDYCPLKLQQNATLRLIVLPPPFVSAPTLDSLDADMAGDVTLYWTPPADPYGIFTAYCIFADTIGNGTYYLVDSITAIQNNMYVHYGANANVLTIHYIMKTYSGCGNTYVGVSTGSNSLVASFVSIDEPSATESLRVGHPYPNPSDGSFTVPIHIDQANVVELSLLDMHGRVVFNDKKNLTAGPHELHVDIAGRKGTFILLIQADKQAIRLPVVIE